MKFYLKLVCDYKFHTITIQAHPHTPLPNHIIYFLTASGRSTENEVTSENLELTRPSHSLDKHQKLKYEILESPGVPHT